MPTPSDLKFVYRVVIITGVSIMATAAALLIGALWWLFS
jgi:hypothetical protein